MLPGCVTTIHTPTLGCKAFGMCGVFSTEPAKPPHWLPSCPHLHPPSVCVSQGRICTAVLPPQRRTLYLLSY